MNCQEARDAMLTADMAELHGARTSALTAHVAACDTCASLARSLRDDLDALDSTIRDRSRRASRLIVTTIPIAAMLIGVAALAHRKAQPQPQPRIEAAAPAVPRGVSVQIAPGQQAAVFATKDTNVTVVWITTEGGL